MMRNRTNGHQECAIVRTTSYQRYEYNDDLSEGSPVIDDTSTEWRVASYQRHAIVTRSSVMT